MVGLIDADAAEAFDPMNVDYGMMVGGSSLLIYEKGVCKGSYGPYKAGDRIGVVVMKGVVTYVHGTTTIKQTLPSESQTPLRIVVAFRGTGAKATALTLIKETVEFQRTRIPIEFSGQGRGDAIKAVLKQYGRPFTIEIRRPPAKTYYSYFVGDSNNAGAARTAEEQSLENYKNLLKAVDCERQVLQFATTTIRSHKLCWDWWVEKLDERGFGPDHDSGLFAAIEEELDESGERRKHRLDGAGLLPPVAEVKGKRISLKLDNRWYEGKVTETDVMQGIYIVFGDGQERWEKWSSNLLQNLKVLILPQLEQMGFKASSILKKLSPAQLATNERLGIQLTCSKHHLFSFKHLWQGDQRRPSVLVPYLDMWEQWLEVTIPKQVYKQTHTSVHHPKVASPGTVLRENGCATPA
jgi:hypothetical protein